MVDWLVAAATLLPVAWLWFVMMWLSAEAPA